MEQALLKAQEAGYESPKFGWETDERSEQATILLDPEFWKCLGKALGWTVYDRSTWKEDGVEQLLLDGWRAQWNRFFDHLAEGKSPDDFFKNLLSLTE